MHALHDHTGKRVQYDELLAATPETMLKEIEPGADARTSPANEAAMNRVSEVLMEAEPDIVIIIGDDHKEVYQEDNMPALAVYWGDTLPYGRKA